MSTPALVSGEMRCSGLGNCHLQAGCSHTAIAEHKFPLQCGPSNLSIFTQDNSSLFCFHGLSVRLCPSNSTTANGTDPSQLSL